MPTVRSAIMVTGLNTGARIGSGWVSVRAIATAALVAFAWMPAAHASEGGASIYLLGSGGPEAAVMPPLQGVYFSNAIYTYTASPNVNRQFVVGGNVVAGLKATIVADFLTTLWVPTTHFAGGTLALGVAVPIGAPLTDVDVIITGPRGRQFSLSRHDSALVVADPVATAMIGWKTGKLHIQASTMLNIPIGRYREGQLANLSFHRWAGDASLALSWNDPTVGWDVSGKFGFTFNGTNNVTDYKTGTEFHLEGAVEKSLSRTFSAGLQAYYFKQVSGDSGSGASLGSFEGKVIGLGGTVAAHVVMGRSPATIRLQVFREFDATNRLQGTAVMLGLSLPLSMKMPATAPR